VAKTLGYLLAGNAGELLVVLVAAVLGWPLPLLPIHLLWINLVTDGLPALGLATDPVDSDVLARPPRDVRKSMVDAGIAARTIGTGLLSAGVALTAFAWHLDAGIAEARTAAFSVLVFDELLRAFPARSATRTVWEIGMLSNLRLLAIVAASAALQALILQLPVLHPVFGIAPMGPSELVEWLALAAVPAIVLELVKLIARSGAVRAIR
jgi:Ca2+-transporting ATPase